ncbi:MAG: hypothetical protein O9327_10570 [Polaromonas sp.]|nr:hypothetical protein [Polaromonas sp.]
MKTHARICIWGNSLAIRISLPLAAAAGLSAGDQVAIDAKPGALKVQRMPPKSLGEMLEAYDPARHGVSSLERAPR